MKCSFYTATLRQSVASVMPLVAKKSPKEVLTFIKLAVADDGNATVTSNNLEASAVARLKAVGTIGDEPGECLLPGERFSKLIRELDSAEISIEAEKNANGHRITVRAGKQTFKYDSCDPAEFPEFPAESGDMNRMVVPAGMLKSVVNRVALASDREEGRYAMNSIAIIAGLETVEFVSTDSRILIHETLPVLEYSGVEGDAPVLIPPYILKSAASGASGSGQCEIKSNQNCAVISTGDIDIYTRQIEGRFPPHKKFTVEPEVNGVCRIMAGELLRGVRLAAMFTQEETRSALFSFGVDGLTLRSNANQVGASEVPLECEYEGPEMKVALDPQFIAPYMATLDADDDVMIKVIDAEQQVRFRVGSDNGPLLVCMPLRQG